MRNIVMTVAVAMAAMVMSGCSTTHMGWTAVTQQHKLDPQAMGAFDDMFTKVTEYGDPARAMMLEWNVSDDVSNEEVAESIKALAEEYNMRVTGDTKMYTKDDAAPTEVKHARIFSMCSLPIAKVFLNYSRYYGGFMPCRIIMVEYGNGKRVLVSMNMMLAIHGGYELPPEMLKMATHVKTAMEEVPARAAKGDF